MTTHEKARKALDGTGLYRQPKSPYFWMRLPAVGDLPRARISTGIVAGGKSAINDAITLRATQITARAQGSVGIAQKKTSPRFADFAAWYIEHKLRQRKHGGRTDRSRIDRLIAVFGSKRLHRITVKMVDEWSTVRTKTVSASTVNRDLDELKVILASAVDAGELTASPLVGHKRLRATQYEAQVLTPADAGRILDALTGAERAFVALAYYTAMRLGDCIGLEYGHIKGDKIRVPDPKNGLAYTVPVSPKLRDELAALPRHIHTGATGPCETCRTDNRARCPHVFAALRTRKDPAGLKDRVRDIFERACARAGVTYGRKNGGVTFHSLRHTAATRMAEAGFDATTIAAIGGWKSTTMVLHRYVHASDKRKADAVAAIALTA